MKNSTHDRIEALLYERNISQRELAQKIGVTDTTISRYVNGARQPRAEIITLMANALNTTTDYLLCHTNSKLGTVMKDGKALPLLSEQQYILAEYIGEDITDEEIIELSHYFRFLKHKRGK